MLQRRSRLHPVRTRAGEVCRSFSSLLLFSLVLLLASAAFLFSLAYIEPQHRLLAAEATTGIAESTTITIELTKHQVFRSAPSGAAASTATAARTLRARTPVQLTPRLKTTHTVLLDDARPSGAAAALHDRPTLAARSGVYPELAWPRYGDDTSAPFPPLADFNRSRNPTVLLAYSGSFWGWAPPPHTRQCPVPCAMASNQ
jgi:hypothetical protein